MKPLEDLVSVLDPDRVCTAPEVLEGYGRDSSLARACMPEAVISAESTGQVQEVVHWANRWSVPVIPVSSGPPRLRGDTVPTLGGVILDLQEMKKIIRIDRRNRVANCQERTRFHVAIGIMSPRTRNRIRSP